MQENINLPICYAGIDIGSTTLKIMVLDETGAVRFTDYRRHNTDIIATAQAIFQSLMEQTGDCLLEVVMTGSVGMGYAERANIPFVQEVVAAAELVRRQFPQVSTFVDIGGEDSKMIFFAEGKTPDIRMNGSCAGGTGAFIDQTASLLGVETLELNALAEKSENIYPIASRCGVFSRTDIQNLASRNVSKSDIAASVFNAVAMQVISSLARGMEITPKLFFCGGPFHFLPELKKAFLKQLQLTEADCIPIGDARLIPSWGCALIAQQRKQAGQKPAQKLQLSQLLSTMQDKNGQAFRTPLFKRLPALFQSEAEFEHWKKAKGTHEIPRIDWDHLTDEETFLGIDSGSTTTKIVLIDKRKRILFQDYLRNEGDSFKAMLKGMERLQAEATKHEKKIRIANSATTGYGENLIKTAFGLHQGIIETIAHYLAAKEMLPDVSFVLDIGGQDMKAIFIENGTIKRLEINEACSSGCGSFIENFANMLHYPVAEFARMSCFAKAPCDLGTRCTVFMNSKVKQAMREGAGVDDIAAGFSYSVIKNCLFKVLKLKDVKELGNQIVVQGGTFRNLSIVKALEELSGVKVAFSDIPELMGAYGAALYALEKHRPEDKPLTIGQLANSQAYDSHFEHCSGCENKCTVKVFDFANGNTFYAGNNCEKIYSNRSETERKGTNQYQERYKMLFQRTFPKERKPRMTIGIPRGLGMYEHYPFWHTLFTECGIRPVLSRPSTNQLYNKGIRTIMSDNICFPAKLMHGHILDLVEKKVDRIFYPYSIFEHKEDPKARNSYNCPVVAGYSDVIRSSIDTEKNYGIPLDAPSTSFNNLKLLKKSCTAYLKSLGVPSTVITPAFEKAWKAQQEYVWTLAEQNRRILEKAKKENRMVILLAGRPYHIDPLIQHKIADSIADMGIDVITENISLFNGDEVYDEINGITQWAYPNRILKAARFVAGSEENIHFVELTSFGCGPDAFITDEVNEVLKRKGKNLTLLKIDDMNNIGSLRLRIRSLVESLKFHYQRPVDQPVRRLPVYTKEDRHRKILAPYFAEGYSEFLPSIFALMGYELINLPMGSKEAEETGLKYANNEVCYPNTLVVGSIIQELQSGKYRPEEVTVAITQTGGQCRASNYIAIIKDAMLSAGFDNIPVVSVAFGDTMMNEQPGFKLKLKGNILITYHTLLYADCLSRLYHASVVREKEKGMAQQLRNHYTEAAFPFIARRDHKGLLKLFEQAVKDFDAAILHKDDIPVIGVVGEIYVKYNSFSHKNVLNWLAEQGVEVIAPSMYNFFFNSFVNKHINKRLNIMEVDLPLFVTDTIYKLAYRIARKFDAIGRKFK
ncbi:MAG: 2-hydroxyacyl-CoA dehydratase, partial [Bacteroidales bacterium]|nr:2-hydroxyacyl-CoA dehydratase [Bacteroidales bacterium]